MRFVFLSFYNKKNDIVYHSCTTLLNFSLFDHSYQFLLKNQAQQMATKIFAERVHTHRT
jgi:hypothetical protein